MGENPELGEGGESAEIAVVDSPNLEYVIRADDNAIAFGFAPRVIDDWHPFPCRGIASFSRTLRVLGGPAFLGKCLISVTHGLSSLLGRIGRYDS
jgi:hypothetical protein